MSFLEKMGFSDLSATLDDWMVQVFIIILVALLVNFFLKRLINKLADKAGRSKNPWDDAFILALSQPIRLLVWVVGVTFAAHIIKEETGETIFDAVDPIRDVGVIVCILWFLIRGVKNVESNVIDLGLQEDPSYDKTTAVAVSKLVRLALMITGALVCLQTLGISVSGVLAFGGVGGIAIGFAARDLLANFFGGLMVYLDRPFSVGDWVRSPDRNIEGTVEDIGWRLTRIRTFDKRPLYVPNSIFTSIVVENPSRMSNRRIKETIGIRYEDLSKMETIVQQVKEMLIEHEGIDAQQTLMVNFNQFNNSSLDFFIYTFTKTTNWARFHAVKEDVLMRIADIVEGEGAQMAYPTQTLHLENMPDIHMATTKAEA